MQQARDDLARELASGTPNYTNAVAGALRYCPLIAHVLRSLEQAVRTRPGRGRVETHVLHASSATSSRPVNTRPREPMDDDQSLLAALPREGDSKMFFLNPYLQQPSPSSSRQ